MGFLRKLKQLPIFAMVFTYVFLTSSLIISTLCLLLMAVVWPISKSLYRRVSSWLVYTVFAQFAWVTCEWSGMKIHAYGEKEAYDSLGRESCLIILNHRGELDWLAGFTIAARYNFVHTMRALTKRSVLFIPGFGQLLWVLEFPFLSRNFAKDEVMIRKASEEYKEYPFPIQICIFCEGTRFTEAKYERGVQYAKEKGLKELKHHLIPRTKGFAILAQSCKINARFPALYDLEFAYPRNVRQPNVLDILMGKQVEMHFHLKRYPMDEIPATQEELNSYCHKLFEQKDEAYDHYLQNGKFPAPEQSFLLPASSLWLLRLIMFGWGLLLLTPLLYLLLTLPWSTLAVIIPTISAVSLLTMLSLLWFSHIDVKAKKTG